LTNWKRLSAKNIRFVHHELIPDKIFEESEKLLSKTDPDDVPFVGLAKFLKAPLRSGDKRLMKKVRATHFIKTIDTETLFDFLH
jgi:predicted nucleic acid-binding protein